MSGRYEEDSDGDEYRCGVTLCTAHETAQECENSGHVENEGSEVVESVMAHSFNDARAHEITDGSVGLDSISSVDVFGDKRLLANIRPVPKRMKIICNADKTVVTKMGDLGGYGPVWYHPQAIENILSISNVQKRYKVRYDSGEGDFFTLLREDGSTRTFRPTETGLYASQMLEPRKEVAMVSMVEENQKRFIKPEVRRAKEARRLMAIIVRPREQNMREIVSQKQLIK